MKKYVIMISIGIIFLVGILLIIVKSSNENIVNKGDVLQNTEDSNTNSLQVVDDGTKVVPEKCYSTYNTEVYNKINKAIEEKNSGKESSVKFDKPTDECLSYHPVYKIEDGEYKGINISGSDKGTFSMISEDDNVNLKINGSNYTLNKQTPTLVLQLDTTDEVEVTSKSKKGVVYDTHVSVRNDGSDEGIMDSSSSSDTKMEQLEG